MAVPIGNSAEVVIFGSFKRVVFVSATRRGTLLHSNVFSNILKIVLRGRCTILQRFQK